MFCRNFSSLTKFYSKHPGFPSPSLADTAVIPSASEGSHRIEYQLIIDIVFSRKFCGFKFPPALAGGGQTQKSSDLQKYKLSGRSGLLDSFLLLFIRTDTKRHYDLKSLILLKSNLRNNSASAESVFNHPGRERRIVNIPGSAIPATPP